LVLKEILILRTSAQIWRETRLAVTLRAGALLVQQILRRRLREIGTKRRLILKEVVLNLREILAHTIRILRGILAQVLVL
jgi:hypothetical protein